MLCSQIISDVALLLGADPDQMIPWGSSPYPGLADRIMAETEDCAALAVAATPRMQLTGWRRLPTAEMTVGKEGMAILPLPDDFLTLFSLRMQDWEREVTEILPADHPLHKLQHSRWHGLRGTPRHPLIFETLTGEGRRALGLFSTTLTDPTAEGWYLPAPVIKDSEIVIPPAAYRKMTGMIAARIREPSSC